MPVRAAGVADFGLPYRFGRLSFRHTDESGAIEEPSEA